jgi:hypothetical protein
MAVMVVDVDAPVAVKERLEAFAGEVLVEAMNRPVQLVNGGLYLRGLLEQGSRKSLEDWCADEQRRRKTKIPDEVVFKTKPELGVELVERAASLGLFEPSAQRLQRLGLVERVYARVDPHPAFRRVQLSSRFEHSRGRISTSVEDTLANVVVKRPGTVLSSSQLNALAVSIFLAFNLGVLKRPLDSVLLDDPLQSLDDVNLLGLVDLLRRTKQRRQLIVSTHDPRFAALLERTLRPGADTSTIIVDLSGWRREGPRVEQRRLPAEAQPLRLVA